MFIIAAFYHFFDFLEFAGKRQALVVELQRLGIKGSLLIAPEGINGTLAGTRESIDSFLLFLKENIVRGEFEHKESLCDYQPFARTKVRLKKEIIAFGKPTPSLALPRCAGEGIRPSSLSPKGGGAGRGIFIEPRDWNRLIDDPEMLVLDARNHYEVHLGTFARAVDPDIRTFKQLPAFVKKNLDAAQHKKIATFCTGGIRCEKLSAWLVEQGFEQVYQLKGGILKYLEEIPESESRWHGECYVFDERVAVGHGLAPSQTATMCPACGAALKAEDRRHPFYKEKGSCPYCQKKDA